MVKRSYHAPRRQARARATHAAILDSAHRLFVSHGYASTSIRRIAVEAGVGEQTVYRLFKDKPSLLREVILVAVAGGGSGVARESELMAAIAERDSPRDRLEVVAEWIHDSYLRGLADLEEVLSTAALADPRLGDLSRFAREQRYQDVVALVRAVIGDAPTRDGVALEDVADYIYAVESSPVYRQLVGERGWSTRKYVNWFVRLVDRMFFVGPLDE